MACAADYRFKHREQMMISADLAPGTSHRRRDLRAHGSRGGASVSLLPAGNDIGMAKAE